MKTINSRLDSKLVDRPHLKVGNIVVVCSDDDVIMIEKVCNHNIEMLERLPEIFNGCGSLYFLNFSRGSFMHLIDDLISRVKK